MLANSHAVSRSAASTASCSRPLVATALPPCGPGCAVQVGERPPASRTRMSSGARSHSLHLRLDGDVDGALGDQAVRPEVAVAAHPPHRVGEVDERRTRRVPPGGQVGERQAGRAQVGDGRNRDRREQIAVERREGALTPRRPPPPLQRGRADDADDSGTPSTSSAISVAHTGTPRTKFLVPSIGSITHWRPVNSVVPPNSSPNTESSGRCVGQPVAQQRLGVPVGVGDRRQVGFGLDAQVHRAEASAWSARRLPRPARGPGPGRRDVRGVGAHTCRPTMAVWPNSRSCCSSSVPSRSSRRRGSCARGRARQ